MSKNNSNPKTKKPKPTARKKTAFSKAQATHWWLLLQHKQYERGRMEAALKAMKMQGRAGSAMLKQAMAGEKQDRTALKTAHVEMSKYDPECKVIFQFIMSQVPKDLSVPAKISMGNITMADLEQFIK
jgi:hypothetical protein